MLSQIRSKIRSLIEDISKSDYQIFVYTNSNIFTMAEPNISSISDEDIYINGNVLGSGESSSFSSSTKKLTISGVDFSSGDSIEVNYDYTRYSDSELNEYIRASLVWLSVYGYKNFELESTLISPTPTREDESMIALVASELIKPDWISYKLPDVSINYPSNLPKEKRIKELVCQFGKNSLGVGGLINWIDSYYDFSIQEFPIYVTNLVETRNLDLIINEGTNTSFYIEIHDKNKNLIDLTGGMLYFTVKENLEDEDSEDSTNESIIQKDITPSTPTEGNQLIELTTSDTDLTGIYLYDIKYIDENDNHFILAKGTIKFVKSITERV